MTTLGREIKKARAALGWRQQRLQEATGISQKYLSRIENDHVDPSWSFVLKIAQALNMDLRTLYKDNGILGVSEVTQPTLNAATPREDAYAKKAPEKRQRSRKAAPVG
jgi:transcriptional regulator with XRE-family HTH domain